MTENPITLQPESTVFQAVKTMVSRNIGSILVIEKGELKGILTEKDVLSRVLAKELDIKTTKLKDVMSKPVITIEDKVDLVEASELMKKKNIRRLAVLNTDGKLVGIISSDDIARSLRRSAEELAITYHILSRPAHKP
jgi:CBS domain-containing protein